MGNGAKLTDLITKFDTAWKGIDGAKIDGRTLRLSKDELAAMYDIYSKADQGWVERRAVDYVRHQIDTIRMGFKLKSLAKWSLGDKHKDIKFEFLQAEHLVGLFEDTVNEAKKAKAEGRPAKPVDPAELYNKYVSRISAGLDR